MKKLLLFLPFLIFLSCGDDDKPSSPTVPVSQDCSSINSIVISNYTDDAKRLYMQELIMDSSNQNFNNRILDSTQINNILCLINKVYESQSVYRDSVFDHYDIDARYCYAFSSLYIKVDTSRQEIKNLVNGIIPTGESNLDAFLNLYEFDSVEPFFNYPNFNWLTLHTKKEFNLIPAESEVIPIPSIILGEFNKGCAGDGNNITISRNSVQDTITFSIGWGDCPAGCIFHRYWEWVTVADSVAFSRVYGN